MIETFRPASWVLSIGVTAACFVDCGTKADDRDVQAGVMGLEYWCYDGMFRGLWNQGG